MNLQSSLLNRERKLTARSDHKWTGIAYSGLRVSYSSLLPTSLCLNYIIFHMFTRENKTSLSLFIKTALFLAFPGSILIKRQACHILFKGMLRYPITYTFIMHTEGFLLSYVNIGISTDPDCVWGHTDLSEDALSVPSQRSYVFGFHLVILCYYFDTLKIFFKLLIILIYLTFNEWNFHWQGTFDELYSRPQDLATL